MMAKKKIKKIGKAEPKRAPKKKTSTAGWVVGAIIVIVIIVAIVLLLRSVSVPKEPAAPTAPAETPKAPAPTGPEAVSAAPEQVKSCSISYAIGWPKNKLGDPCVIDGNKVELQMIYSGKGDSLGGLWFQITTKSGEVKYLKDTRAMKKDDYMTYGIDVGEKITELLTMPIISIDGVDKACLNQRMLVIKESQCVTG